MSIKRNPLRYLVPDLVVAVVLGILMVTLNECGLLEPLLKFPMILAYVCYTVGRIVSVVQFRRALNAGEESGISGTSQRSN